MGNDGGSLTNKRRTLADVSRQQGRSNDDGGQQSAAERTALERAARWRTCRLSGRLLRPPIAADKQGNLFNKPAVVQRLLARKADDASNPLLAVPGLDHLRKLKDIKELVFTPPADVAAKLAADPGAVLSEHESARLVQCPITDLCAGLSAAEFGCFWECGHVCAAAALVQAAAEGTARATVCPVCEQGTTWVVLGGGTTVEAAAPAAAASVAAIGEKRARDE